MRVVYLSASGRLGGAETSLLELVQAVQFARPDWDLVVVVPAAGPLEERLRSLGISVHVLPYPEQVARLGESGFSLLRLGASAWHISRYASAMRRLLARLSPDVIHANGLKMHILSAWARPKGTPLLWHIHDYVGSRRLTSRIFRLHAGRCDLAICNSHSVARDLGNTCAGLRSEVVYNGVSLDRFSPSGPALDLDALSQLPPAEAGICRVGLLGTFAQWKGHSIFLQAFAQLAKDLPVRAYVIGGPIYETLGSQRTLAELRGETEDLGISAHVGFTGFLEDTPAALRALDIVVHASTAPEPFGMVIIEALACQKPVVVSLSGGAAEIVQDNQTGLAHRPGDAAGLAAQLRRLVNDRELGKTLAANGRKVVEREFGAQQLSERILPLYEHLRPVRSLT